MGIGQQIELMEVILLLGVVVPDSIIRDLKPLARVADSDDSERLRDGYTSELHVMWSKAPESIIQRDEVPL